MPALKRPDDAASGIELPPRAGASLAGGRPTCWWSAAARPASARRIGAADAGASVVLAERYGVSRRQRHRGAGDAAHVVPYRRRRRAREEGRDHAAAAPITGRASRSSPACSSGCSSGWCSAGGAIAPSLATGYVVPFDPEWFKLIALELLDEAGVQFLFHAFASGVLGASAWRAWCSRPSPGPLAIRARVIVDCTGDGDVAVQAGAPSEIGRADGLVQPMTLMFRMVEFQRAAFEAYVARATRSSGAACTACGTWCARRPQAGELELPREDILFFATPHERRGEREQHARDARARHRRLGSDATPSGRAGARCARSPSSCASYVPGFEESYVVQSGVQVGVRETRRIIGEYQLTADDVLARAQVRRRDRARRLPDRHPQSRRAAARCSSACRRARPTTSRCAACCRRTPSGLHRRRALHLGHARSAFVLSRDADRDGDRPGRRRVRRARRARGQGGARRAGGRRAARAAAPGRRALTPSGGARPTR